MIFHSFQKYIAEKFYNDLYNDAIMFVEENKDSFYSHKLHITGDCELEDMEIKTIWIEDSTSMLIKFKVVLSLNVFMKEGAYNYDNVDEKDIWIVVLCSGNLEKGLSDFEILDHHKYERKERFENALNNNLVPYIRYENLEDVATEILSEYYPEILVTKDNASNDLRLDPFVLAERLGLSVEERSINGELEIYGQIYFDDAKNELYNSKTNEYESIQIKANTIIVDPNVKHKYGIGAFNNTIVHECIHWIKHRKIYVFEKLCSDNLNSYSCEPIQNMKDNDEKESAKFIEIQASQLAPRIQMPKELFIAKANEYISKFKLQKNTEYDNEVMEDVIKALSEDFTVSKQSAKVRMIELGFESAIGTFTYLDNHYLKPHSAKKGYLEYNQTFSISFEDAGRLRMTDDKLRSIIDSGDYIFIDNHYIYNSPLYVEYEKDGPQITRYALSHMDECAIKFELKIEKDIIHEYERVCFLNREDTSVSFEYIYKENGIPREDQIA